MQTAKCWTQPWIQHQLLIDWKKSTHEKNIMLFFFMATLVSKNFTVLDCVGWCWYFLMWSVGSCLKGVGVLFEHLQCLLPITSSVGSWHDATLETAIVLHFEVFQVCLMPMDMKCRILPGSDTSGFTKIKVVPCLFKGFWFSWFPKNMWTLETCFIKRTPFHQVQD